MQNKLFLKAADICELLEVKRTSAYEIIGNLNKELEEQGYLTLRGKVPTKYFVKRFYGVEDTCEIPQEEFNAFLETVSDKPETRMAFLLLYWTGMRIGEQLVIPVYLNEKIVLDMLAIIEDGFSKVSEVSTSYESADKINTKIETGFSTKNILEKLLKIQLNAHINGDSMESDRESSKSEKVHTNVSLFSKFRVALTNNNLLFCKAGNEINIKECITGDFIVENENVTLVLSAQEKYLSNDNISELLGGRFKVLGKIIKICHDENEKSIYLGKPVWEY